MRTIIELQGEKLNRYLSKKQVSETMIFLLGEGEHETIFGTVGLRFASSVGNVVALLDCSKCKVLQTRGHGTERKIAIRRDGLGQQNLTNGVNLLLYTDTTLDKFRKETRAEMHFRQDRDGWIKTHI